jgi:hypothetical protein
VVRKWWEERKKRNGHPGKFRKWPFFCGACENSTFGQDQLGLSAAARTKFPWITVDASFYVANLNGGSTVGESNPVGYFSMPSVSCLQFIPQQTSPLDATFEYGYRSQPLDLVFIDVAGHVQKMEWDSAGGSASGPYDLGPPSPTVAAAGKPSIVWSLYEGERIFVKGTDNALWMHWAPNGGTGQWNSLGGTIYGDPKAVVWNNGQLIDVFVLGTDDNIYYYGMTPSILYGWSGLYWSGTSFVGPPTVVSRDGQSLDLFANAEDGGVRWMSCTSTGCWTAPDDVLAGINYPNQGTPTVAVDPHNNTMQLFSTALMGYLQQTSWTPGGNWAGGNWFIPGNGSTLQGIASVSWGAGHFDAFSVSRQGELWWWYTNNPTNFSAWTNGDGYDTPLVFGGGPYTASGDPLAKSRYANEVEVFYRTTSGQLAHLTYNGTVWQWPPEITLQVNTIQ